MILIGGRFVVLGKGIVVLGLAREKYCVEDKDMVFPNGIKISSRLVAIDVSRMNSPVVESGGVKIVYLGKWEGRGSVTQGINLPDTTEVVKTDRKIVARYLVDMG